MDIRNFTFMFYGFLAAWLILVVYVLSLVSRNHLRVAEVMEVCPPSAWTRSR